jgi:hydroxymethylbilane synthase
MAVSRTFRIGTRASQLARRQTDWVASQLAERGLAAEIVEIATTGDVKDTGPVAALGVQGAFTKEIQAAMLAGQIDLAIHSLKDLPTQTVDGLALAATPVRENPADALVANGVDSLAGLPPGARVGTGSLRRRAQLLHLRSDLQIVPIRGNVDTRIRKATSGEVDAVVLAAAGLLRMELDRHIAELLAPPRMLPAPGQGALALECRADDADALQIAGALDDVSTRLGTMAERTMLAALDGGCSAPIAAWGRVVGSRLFLDGLVADANGRQVLRAAGAAELAEFGGDAALAAPATLGRQVADELLRQGAATLIADARGA